MALPTGAAVATLFSVTQVPGKHSLPTPLLISSSTRRAPHVARARRVSSRTKKALSTAAPPTTTTNPREELSKDSTFIEQGPEFAASDSVDDGYFLPELPGDKPNFWEGPQWNAFGFFVQYLWAFGIVFALVACGIAVVTYNEGATDFKQTPVYKESIQSQDLLDEPEGSNADVFEGNPTEDAPSLE